MLKWLVSLWTRIYPNIRQELFPNLSGRKLGYIKHVHKFTTFTWKEWMIFASTAARVINNITYLLQQVSTLLDVSDFVIDSLTAQVR